MPPKRVPKEINDTFDQVEMTENDLHRCVQEMERAGPGPITYEFNGFSIDGLHEIPDAIRESGRAIDSIKIRKRISDEFGDRIHLYFDPKGFWGLIAGNDGPVLKGVATSINDIFQSKKKKGRALHFSSTFVYTPTAAAAAAAPTSEKPKSSMDWPKLLWWALGIAGTVIAAAIVKHFGLK